MNDIKNALPIGTILTGGQSSYRITKALGQGTFGITYLAEILEADGRSSNMYVCIKEFFMRDINGRSGTDLKCSSDKGTCENYMAKFKREADRLVKIQDDHIVRVIESFKANNTVYYAMSFIAGGSLDEMIQQKGSLSELETLRIAAALAFGLKKLHGYGMVHLDLKPANVMMMGGHYPVIIDFGLAKHFNESGQPESSTSVGAGTPGYSPIEQAHYNGKDNNPWPLDIYAVGCIMYKMLTGERAATAADIFNNGFNTSELQKEGVSPEMIAIVKKAMEPMKNDRYQKADELMNDLNNLLAIRKKEPLKEPEPPKKKEIPNQQPPKTENNPPIIFAEVHPAPQQLQHQPQYPPQPQPIDDNRRPERKNSNVMSYLLMFAVAIVVGAIVFFGIRLWRGEGLGGSSAIADTTMVDDSDAYANATPYDISLTQTQGKGMPASLDITISGDRVKGTWHTRIADTKVRGTFVDGKLTLNSKSNSASLTLQEMPDGKYEGTYTSPDGKINNVTFSLK